MLGTSFCKGKSDCFSIAIFCIIAFILIFIKCFSKLYNIFNTHTQNSSSSSSSTSTNNDLNRLPIRSFPRYNPLYCHALQSMPIVVYDPAPSTSNGNDNGNDKFEDENCSICLGEFEKGEKIRVLPRCKHIYHKECIENWLIRVLTCPLCRRSVIDDPQYHQYHDISIVSYRLF